MRRILLCNTIILYFTLLTTILSSQNIPIVFEAESAMIGSELKQSEEDGITFIITTTNSAANNPESANRIMSFELTFQHAQQYDLYARIRVGQEGANDDSFLYGNGFGAKDPTANADWIRANNLASVGYNNPLSYVEGQGGVGTNQWKWINLSEFTGDVPALIFNVETTNTNLVFQVGAREDGLDFDKFAFARADYFFTVENLDNVESGSASKEEGPSQEPIAQGNEKILGNIWSSSQEPGFLNYWNQVTPENAGKWGSVESTRDNMNWNNLDKAYALAKDNKLPFRFHVLIWGNQQPSWIENLPPEEQKEEIVEWFQAVAERYPDIDVIEVVNEPLHDPPNTAGSGGGNYIEALGGTGATGVDWIIEAFRLARETFPNAKLAINDYNIISSSPNVNRYLAIINNLKAENLIDMVGFQAHAFSTRGSVESMKANLDKLAESGLPLFASELDIDGPDDDTQLMDYQRIFPVIWEHPAVVGVTLWGYRPGLWRNEQKAYLIDTDGVTERPALVWLREYVAGTTTSAYENVEQNKIKVFPNPVKNQALFIDMDAQHIQKLELISLNGQRIMSYSKKNRIIIPEFVTPGLYFLRLESGNKTYIQRIIIH